ncbi:hypothetical protein SASPL_131459 [Salvia splendens]|uniref:Uncharacterized protein n=1 Tax=Salvia splendens TaxID=180675 RepID=A0A8X8ZKM0_SALSN|nr:hypothetical protein SASPL_131459 [Salvia splendens]
MNRKEYYNIGCLVLESSPKPFHSIPKLRIAYQGGAGCPRSIWQGCNGESLPELRDNPVPSLCGCHTSNYITLSVHYYL